MVSFSQLSECLFDTILISIPGNSQNFIAIFLPAIPIAFNKYSHRQQDHDPGVVAHDRQVMIIIMFNSINKEIINTYQPSAQPYQERLELPQLIRPSKMRIPINYIKKYFQVKSLINIPHIAIANFYEKIHKVRTLFISHIPNPQEFLIKQYNLRLPLAVNDHLIPNAKHIIHKMQLLEKQKFVYQEEVDIRRTKRVYFGEMVLGKKQGYGIYAEYQSNTDTQDNGSHFYFYQGFFSQNNKNGLGVQWSNNRIYIGQFINNAYFSHTQAVFLYSNGDLYIGSVFNNKRNGRGVLFQSKAKLNQYYRYETSQRYDDYEGVVVGYWDNDQLARKKKFLLTTGFRQIFQINLYDFQSNLLIKAASIYTGDIKKIHAPAEDISQKQNFIKQGKGFEYFCNGDIYKGQYLNNRPHGHGRYIWGNKDEYIGQFFKGHREGSGQWKGQNGEEFCGEYQADKRSGYGVYRWPNGNVYEGEFRNDNRHGVGKMSWSNGQNYLGKWKNGLQHGKGQVRVSLYTCNLQSKLQFQNGKPTSSPKKKSTAKTKTSPDNKQIPTDLAKTNKIHRRQSMDVEKSFKPHTEVKKTKSLPKQIKKKYQRSSVHQQSMFQKMLIEDYSKIKVEESQEEVPRVRQLGQQEILNKQTHIKTSNKAAKRQKMKNVKLQRQMEVIPKLGETLLKPIKWSNFKESCHQPIL